jgi:hypothetical protein
MLQAFMLVGLFPIIGPTSGDPKWNEKIRSRGGWELLHNVVRNDGQNP